MRNFRWTALLLSVLVGGMPAAYAQTVVHKIGISPLLGTTSSTAEIREKIAENPALVRSAAYKVGLTPSEYQRFLKKFNNEKPGWVTIPRHLDAMSWASDGEAHAIYDVIIPAGTNGWEVDLFEPHQIVKVYIPMICGNISVVRQHRAPVAVVRPPLPPPFVAAAPPVIATPVPAPVPLVAAEAPAQEIPPVAPAVVHHPHLLFPILAGVAVAALIIGGNHHHGGSNSSTPPNGGVTVITPPSLPNSGTVTTPNVPIVVPPPSNGGGCGCPTW